MCEKLSKRANNFLLFLVIYYALATIKTQENKLKTGKSGQGHVILATILRPF